MTALTHAERFEIVTHKYSVASTPPPGFTFRPDAQVVGGRAQGKRKVGALSASADKAVLQRGAASAGRRVLVPAALWPDYACDEHGGEGWEAEVQRCVRGRATVRFVHARDAQGNRYPDEHLDISQLTPL